MRTREAANFEGCCLNCALGIEIKVPEVPVCLCWSLIAFSSLRRMASGSSSAEESLRECEAYVHKHNIQQILRDCIVQVGWSAVPSP